ncbi:MAG TPA: vitamin K epoxide reductase family protein [Acidimicrobiales bacterium]|nr:vitamin K epoxide reductase family protein [Acidimicrobiales bacterium]
MPTASWYASGEAYHYLKTPDAALGLLSYAVTLVLAGMRADRDPSTQPFLSLAFGAKVVADAAGGLYLTLEQGSKHRRFCSWCLGATAFSMATVPQVLPEVRAAWSTLRSR